MVEDVALQEVGLSDAGSFDFRLRFSCHPSTCYSPSLLLAIHERWFYYSVPSTNDCIIALFDISACSQRFDGYLYMFSLIR